MRVSLSPPIARQSVGVRFTDSARAQERSHPLPADAGRGIWALRGSASMEALLKAPHLRPQERSHPLPADAGRGIWALRGSASVEALLKAPHPHAASHPRLPSPRGRGARVLPPCGGAFVEALFPAGRWYSGRAFVRDCGTGIIHRLIYGRVPSPPVYGRSPCWCRRNTGRKCTPT